MWDWFRALFSRICRPNWRGVSMPCSPNPAAERTIMNPLHANAAWMTRRHFLGRAGTGLGAIALASLLDNQLLAAPETSRPHFKPRAKRVIYLFQSGAPSQMDLF